MPKQITESAAAPTITTPGRIKVGLITPGWGSSGYYSPQVIENAAADKVWPKGTHVFFDHPSESEMFDRPERSVRDLAAVLNEDAYWDGTGLVAEANVIGPYRDLVTDPVFTEAVGMSIRAGAETTTGEADGRKGTIVTRLVEGMSVDLVTRAGRGGKVLAVLESARSEARETLTDETRTMLDAALNGTGWVMDFDPDASTVVYRREWQEAGEYRSELLQATYQVDGVTATIHDDGVPVRRQTTFVPVAAQQATAEAATTAATQSPSDTPNVPAPAGQSTANESKETTMATTQIEESRLAQLEKDAERVQTLESDHAKQATELAEAHRVIDQGTARDIVRKAAREAGVTVNDFEVAGIAADYPKNENGRIDTDKLAEHARTAVASLAEAHGAGTVTGFGGTPVHTGEVTEADATKAAASAFGRTTKEA